MAWFYPVQRTWNVPGCFPQVGVKALLTGNSQISKEILIKAPNKNVLLENKISFQVILSKSFCYIPNKQQEVRKKRRHPGMGKTSIYICVLGKYLHTPLLQVNDTATVTHLSILLNIPMESSFTLTLSKENNDKLQTYIGKVAGCKGFQT